MPWWLRPKPGSIPEPPPRDEVLPDPENSVWNIDRLKWGNGPVDRTGWTPIGTQPKSDDEPDWRGVVKKNIIVMDPPEQYKFGQPLDPKYFWFDTPDYADPFKKMWYSFKFFIRTGIAIQCVMGIVQGRKFTMQNNLTLLRKYTWPWMLAGMAASTTVVVLANLRDKKDDLYNYTAAGIVFGSIIGRSHHTRWLQAVVTFTPIVVAVKYNAEINGKLFPLLSPRLMQTSMTGSDAEHGFKSGDLRFGWRSNNTGDPGRDVRKVGV